MQKRALAVDTVIVKGNKILLVRRRYPPFRGYWALPGGFVEKGETMKQAAVREAREETGLEIRPVNMIGVYDDPKRDPRGTVSAAYLCDVAGGKIRTSQETSGIRFFGFDEIPDKLAADHSKIIHDTLKIIRWW